MLLTLYVLALAALAVHAPPDLWEPGTRGFIVVIGVLGAWRYGWGAVHLVRALIYRHVVFPRWRRTADRLLTEEGGGGRDRQLFIVVTSFRIDVPTTVAVFRAAFEEAARHPGPATVIAAVVELGDQRLIKAVFRKLDPSPGVRLGFVRTPGTGKRDGLAAALRAVSRARPRRGAAVVVIDGDALLTPGSLGRCLPLLRLMPDVAAVTTDEDCVVRGGVLAREWHRLRFAQRHQLMSSMGLSRRLLTLTGRMSVYRAEVATDPDFIAMVESDSLDHWRLGSFRLLTGEDKSTWLWVLGRGRAMLYVPDVQVVTIEHPPRRSFVHASTLLMLRWFGNMLRANGRAIALGPRRVGGPFVWWCLVDQRLSMWTPLVGPTLALMVGLGAGATPFLYAYALWVGSTRLVQALTLLTTGRRVSGLWPPLIYYGQVYGALVKTYILFRLDRQGWTRQNTRADRRLPAWRMRRHRLGSAYLQGLALGALAVALAFATDLLALPPLDGLF
ncbi:MAG TPA: glycosyltransferase [Geminicoccaceae bacterium]|nr:glycosyltransferase [Geminicoccaceae bacterium]